MILFSLSVGSITTLFFLSRLIHVILDLAVLPGKSLSSYGANPKTPGAGSWAVVTGATDGIGREYALQLANKGFNIFLASRSPEKLGKVAGEIGEFRRNVDEKVKAWKEKEVEKWLETL